MFAHKQEDVVFKRQCVNAHKSDNVAIATCPE
jgi:hypothetical protein